MNLDYHIRHWNPSRGQKAILTLVVFALLIFGFGFVAPWAIDHSSTMRYVTKPSQHAPAKH